MELTNSTVIKDLMRRQGIRFTKSLGQNFLINPTVCPRMADLGGVNSAVGVLEIGPGIGVLTKELALRAKKVVAIELDKGLLPILAQTLKDFDTVEIISGDVLKLNLPALFEEHFSGMEVVVCANLPYYITTPIIMNLLEQRLPISSITVMIQKETAERISAPIPSRAVGSISIAIAYYAKVQQLFSVTRDSFLPPPNVDSAVIKLDVYSAPPVLVECEADFFTIVRACFAQRRKTIHNSISASLSLDKPATLSLLEQAKVAPTARAEALSLEEFAAIANEYTKIERDNSTKYCIL